MAKRTVRTGLVAGALALALVATACSNSKQNQQATTKGTTTGNSASLGKASCGTLNYDPNAKSGGTFTDYAMLSSSGDNTSFDPGVVQTLSESQITTALYDGLTDFDFTQKCSPKLKPLIASGWTANANATVYTFKIKPGMVFSDGTPVLPSNFKLGWERAGSQKLASSYGYLIDYIKGGADLQAGKVSTLPAIVANDKAMTLTVTLSAPNADFPAILSHPFWSPVDKADLAKIGDKTGWGTKGLTIGNGPFMLQSADQNQVVLVPNPKWAGNVYGDKKVKISKLVFIATKDVETAYQAFTSGQGDDAPVPAGEYSQAMAQFKNNTVVDPNLGSYYFDIGEDDPQLGGPANVKLRQAISLAIDRNEINTKVYEGTRTVSTGLVPPGIPGYKPNLCDYCKLDVTKAKQLLSQWEAAGHKLTKAIKINYNTGGSHVQVATLIQADLKKNLGINSVLAPVATTYFKDVAQPGGCQLCRSGWYADYPTYGNFMVDLFSKASIGGNNFGRFDNAQFETLIAKAQAETNDTTRGQIYNQAESLLLNQQTAVIPLVWYTGSQVFRDTVKNFDQPPLGIMLWERISVGN